MKIFRFVVPAALGLMCLSSTLCSARADSIGVNFSDGISANSLAAGTSAGVVAQTNWNNLINETGTNVALKNNLGAATTTRLTYAAENLLTIRSYTPPAGDEQLNNVVLASSTGTAITFTLSNISYSSYDIYVYSLSDVPTEQRTTLGSTSYYGKSPAIPTDAGYLDNNSGTPFTYTRATSTNSAAPSANANYVRFTGLSGASQSFNLTGLSDFSEVNGIQLVNTSAVATPEPSTYAMMAFGLVALCVLGAKRKKDGEAI
jgi:hypothetical protein